VSRVRFTEAVADDLEEIYDYIANDSLAAADKVFMRLQKCWQLLAENPGIGRKRDNLEPNLRSIAEGSYVIFYHTISSGIELVRIVHSSRDMERVFGS